MTMQGRSTQRRTLQEYLTSLSPDQVLAEARTFFARHITIYSAFLDMEGPGWVSFRGQGGEEIVIAAIAAEHGALVRGSTYLFDAQVARFLATLPPATVTAAPAGSQPAATQPAEVA